MQKPVLTNVLEPTLPVKTMVPMDTSVSVQPTIMQVETPVQRVCGLSKNEDNHLIITYSVFISKFLLFYL